MGRKRKERLRRLMEKLEWEVAKVDGGKQVSHGDVIPALSDCEMINVNARKMT